MYPPVCNWAGCYNDIKEHVKKKHLEVCCEYIEGDFKFLYGLNTQSKLFCFIFAYNEIFFSLFEEKDNMLYAVVLYVGPAKNAAKYKYKVEFVNKDDTEGITLMHLTRSYDEELDDVYKFGNCGKVSSYMVSRLKDENGDLKFKLEIKKVCN
jgi:hypothetical protein